MAKRVRFGVLLTQAIRTAAALPGKTIGGVQVELAKGLGFSYENVQRWRNGYVPNRSEQVEYLVRYFARHGLSREWATALLEQASYRNPEPLLEGLWPGQGDGLAVQPEVHLLPARTPNILGRQLELASLATAVGSEIITLVVLKGPPGMGKTTLALEVCYACAGRPSENAASQQWPTFSRIIWIRGSAYEAKEALSGRAASEEALKYLLTQIAIWLEVPALADAMAENKFYRLAELLRLLARQRVLLVLDDYEALACRPVAQFLLDLPASVKVLITSPEGTQLYFPMAPPERVQDVPLPYGLSSDSDAILFVREIAAGLERTKGHLAEECERLGKIRLADDKALASLVNAVSRNPLILQLLVREMAEIDLPLEELAKNLYNYLAGGSMRELQNRLFASAWGRCSREARLIWKTLPLFANRSSVAALKAAVGLEDVDRGLNELRDRLGIRITFSNLGPRNQANQKLPADYFLHGPVLQQQATRRFYEVNSPARAYPRCYPAQGTGEPHQAEDGFSESAARDRQVAYYRDFLCNLPEEDWVGFAAIDEERESIVATIEWALAAEHSLAAELVRHIWYYLYIRGFWPECRQFLHHAKELSKSDPDPSLWLHLMARAGWLLEEQGSHDEAWEQLKRVEERINAIPNPLTRDTLLRETDVLNYLGQVCISKGETKQARIYQRRFLKLSEGKDDRSAFVASYYLARLDLLEGRLGIAEKKWRELLARALRIKWERAHGYTALNLARVLAGQRDFDAALHQLDSAEQEALSWCEPLLLAHIDFSRAQICKH